MNKVSWRARFSPIYNIVFSLYRVYLQPLLPLPPQQGQIVRWPPDEPASISQPPLPSVGNPIQSNMGGGGADEFARAF